MWPWLAHRTGFYGQPAMHIYTVTLTPKNVNQVNVCVLTVGGDVGGLPRHRLQENTGENVSPFSRFNELPADTVCPDAHLKPSSQLQ